MLKMKANTNKKAIQLNAKRPLADIMSYIMTKSEHVWGVSLYIEVQFEQVWTCLEGDQDWVL